MTYWVLDAHTKQLLACSNIRSAGESISRNLRVTFPSLVDEQEDKDSTNNHLTSISDIIANDIDPTEVKVPQFSPDELMGLSFLRTLDDGQVVRAQIVKKINDFDALNHQNLKMLVKLGDGDIEEIIDYVELCDIIGDMIDDEEANPDRPFIYRGITEHQGPIKPTDPNYKGSKYNVKVQWEDGSATWEPLGIIAKDDPITCATYAKDHKLLETEGWKFLRRHARRAKKLQRLIKQAKARQRKRAIKYKFGVQIPRDWEEALKLQKELGHTKWTDAEDLEFGCLDDYTAFKDLGKGTPPPAGYKKIRIHFVYDVKHDLRHRARMVAGGHLTAKDPSSSYAGVVSLKSMRLALLVGELNHLQSCAGDIGSAYLEARTKEKVYVIAGPEFGERAGHTLIILAALYGLRSSGARFHDKLSDSLREEGFLPSFADPDLWYRDAGNCYEYVCVYVDDLLFTGKEPSIFFDNLIKKHNYKLKGVGPPEYHLGGNFERDKDDTLIYSAKTYVTSLLANFERIIGSLPATCKENQTSCC